MFHFVCNSLLFSISHFLKTLILFQIFAHIFQMHFNFKLIVIFMLTIFITILNSKHAFLVILICLKMNEKHTYNVLNVHHRKFKLYRFLLEIIQDVLASEKVKTI